MWLVKCELNFEHSFEGPKRGHHLVRSGRQETRWARTRKAGRPEENSSITGCRNSQAEQSPIPDWQRTQRAVDIRKVSTRFCSNANPLKTSTLSTLLDLALVDYYNLHSFCSLYPPWASVFVCPLLCNANPPIWPKKIWTGCAMQPVYQINGILFGTYMPQGILSTVLRLSLHALQVRCPYLIVSSSMSHE